MKILLKSCKLISLGSDHNGKVVDILISDGQISKISKSIKVQADETVDLPNLHVSKGWFDAKVDFCDPGNEIMEDLASGKAAAQAGGMTAVGLNSSTNPPISNKSQVEYVKGHSAGENLTIHPYGTISHELKGENLAEMYEMSIAGAIGFTDDHRSVSAGIMYRALLYVKNFGGKIISFPWDKGIFGKGYVHEGKVSVLTGLKSIPSIAEHIVVERDLALVEYTESAVHFSGISCTESVELIRAAQKRGLAVTADCYVQNLIFTEEDVLSFDSNYKVLPPLRSESDKEALIAGLKDGTINFVCSDHRPQDIEHKEVEFDNAGFGMIGVQTLFPALNGLPDFDLDQKIGFISDRPRAFMNLDIELDEENDADLTLFDPDADWTLESKHLFSKSQNSPLIGKAMKGKVYGTIKNGYLTLN